MLTPTITTNDYLERNESALVRTSGWEATVSFTELSAFRLRAIESVDKWAKAGSRDGRKHRLVIVAVADVPRHRTQYVVPGSGDGFHGAR